MCQPLWRERLKADHTGRQNPYSERLIGSIRREGLDQVIVLNERHLRRISTDYLRYSHQARPHMALEHNAPEPRVVEPPASGRIIAEPMVGGLHHRYHRCAEAAARALFLALLAKRSTSA